MGWDETTRRLRAVRAAADMIEQNRGRTVPWHEEWEPLFGDRDGLLQALRHRLAMQRSAQLDPELDERSLADARRRLEEQNAGLLRLLARRSVRRSAHVA